MTPEEFISSLNKEPHTNQFSTTIQVIDDYYTFEPTAFTNGKLENSAGENNGSCKIFAFGLKHALSESQTLACFGQFYFREVLENPLGDNHQNIRNFMVYGWNGIKFQGNALNKR